MKAYMCVICGFIYEEEKGHPESGIEPGTKWEDVPLNWQCPDCGAGKEDFEMIEIGRLVAAALGDTASRISSGCSRMTYALRSLADPFLVSPSLATLPARQILTHVLTCFAE